MSRRVGISLGTRSRLSSATFSTKTLDFDFNAAIAPLPEVVQGDLASWVNDHVDDLIREFADDAAVPADGEDGADDDGDDGEDSGVTSP